MLLFPSLVTVASFSSETLLWCYQPIPHIVSCPMLVHLSLFCVLHPVVYCIDWLIIMNKCPCLYLIGTLFQKVCEALVMIWLLYFDCVCLLSISLNPLNPELNPICYLLVLLGAHHFLHVSRIRVKSLTLRRLMSYICGAPILDVSRSHTTTQHSR